MSAPIDRRHGPRAAPRTEASEHRVRGLVLAALLSALAGMVDAIGFLRLGHLFVSFMSGNSTQMALDAGRLRLGEAGAILVLIVLFVAGAAGGQILAHLSGRHHLTAVLTAVMVLLTAAAALGTAPQPMALAMGALNASMHRAGNVSVSLTFVTGTLVRFGQGLGDLVIGRAAGWVWADQAIPWLGLIGGAVLAGAVYARIGSAVAWIPVGLAGALLFWSATIPDPQ